MSKKLLIVESPSKAKTIGKYLGKDFIVQATVGHIRDLPKKELGVDLENNFEPKYINIRGKADVIKKLKSAAKKADEILIATDPDREGEAIAFHISEIIGDKVVKRVLFNEITKAGIQSGLNSPLELDMNKVNAQQARRIMDRLVGYQVSPFLWKSLTYGLSAGRVQSVALRIICEREAEIKKFVPKEYWTISSTLKDKAGETFKSELFKIDGNTPEISTEQESSSLVSKLKASDFRVKEIKQKDAKRNPAPPFTTSTLQQAGARRKGLSPRNTMRIAQQLYEGVQLHGRELVGLITYMRTDSTRIADEAITAVRGYINSTLGNKYLPEQPRYFKKKKGSQDAHEAVRPTDVTITPESIKNDLSAEQFKLYDLIWRRFVASQMSVAHFKQTSIDIIAGDDILFRTTGSIKTFDGYLNIYPDAKSEGDTFVPSKIEVNEILDLIELTPDQHFTKPPGRFSESGLIRELDNKGIGRPSTYSQIITTLYNRDYVNKDEGRMVPTDLGETVSTVLVKSFPNIFNIEFTAKMEEELDQIESGVQKWRSVLSDFYTPFEKTLSEVSKLSASIKESLQEESEEICEVCGKPMIVKWGRFGKFLSCTGYPECKFSKPVEGSEETHDHVTDEKCEKCGGDMVVKRGRNGEFLACSNYPTCKNTKSIPLGIQCPKDGGDIVARRTKRGRPFFGCSNYPDCDFAMWQKPIAVSCPSCEYAFMVMKGGNSDNPVYLCTNCKNEFDKSDLNIEEKENA
ncbi:type I DNA topoisomerase [Candidatus Marinimicrobia bacterium MT.SAG.3]|nr:type I DNA topoisomerase [Candidatus Marinimicrobia bacterium MT.SAG.3]